MENAVDGNMDRFFEERLSMVEDQIRARNVTDRRVLDAMLKVPRHEFVPDESLPSAYGDYPLAIGEGQTISQPYIVALMAELASLKHGDKVLEVGTGCGYQAAVLFQITHRVYTIEILASLFEQSKKRLLERGFKEEQLRCGDGYNGWPEQAPFDAILVAAAPDHAPPALEDQLAPGGRLIIPIGSPHMNQNLVVIEKDRSSHLHSRIVTGVRFVPMTRIASPDPGG
jgi:protein-L-isoaspartate(D-aspartate) O-methyltransferase